MIRVSPVVDVDTLTAAADRLTAAAVDGMRQITARVADRMVAAARRLDPGDSAETAAANPYINIDDLVVIGGEWWAYVDGQLIPFVEQLYRGAHVAWTATLPTISPAWATAVIPPVSQAAAEAYLSDARNRLRGIGNDLWANARAQLLDGFDAGESIDDLAARVRAAVDVTAARAETIARTEVVSASNIGAIDTARTLPAEITKVWMATPDDRTRPTHVEADGQRQPIDDPFAVGDAALDVPGDPTGPPEEIINCRCVPGWEFPDDPQGGNMPAPDPVTEPVPVPVTAAADVGDGAMIALIPAADDAARLAVPDGEPAEQLHVTLMYLGDAAAIDGDTRARIVDAVAAAAAGLPPVDASAFGVATFNPHTDDRDTAVVLTIGGDGVDAAHTAAAAAVDAAGSAAAPDQHAPWHAHLTLAYVDDDGADAAAAVLDRLGPVRFDRIRVAFAGEDHDVELGATVTAAAAPPPTVEHFVTSVAEGVSTGFRTFEPGALQWRTPPIAYHWERSSAAHGGMMQVSQVGVITRIWRDGNTINFAGALDLDSDVGAEYGRQLAAGFARWSSIGLDEQPTELEFVWPEDTDTDDGEGADDLMMLFEEPEQIIIKSGTIGEVTAVSVPALADAGVEPTDALLADLQRRGIWSPPESAPAADDTAPAAESAPAADAATPVVAAVYNVSVPDCPPAAWFDEPVDVDRLGALTITDEGRIYGYVAPAGIAHRAYRDRRIEAPMGRVDYTRWMGGETIVDGGGRVVTGPITMNCGHIPPAASNDPATRMEHYDNTCSVIATARVGENRHGVWIAGALLPGVTGEQLARAMACRLSGDWAPHPERRGWREFVAALLVPVPGFPMARSGPSVTVQEGALVASSVPVWMESTPAPSTPVPGGQAALRALARSIGRDPATRLRQMRDRVHNGT